MIRLVVEHRRMLSTLITRVPEHARPQGTVQLEECVDCGAVVSDMAKHRIWHDTPEDRITFSTPEPT